MNVPHVELINFKKSNTVAPSLVDSSVLKKVNPLHSTPFAKDVCRISVQRLIYQNFQEQLGN